MSKFHTYKLFLEIMRQFQSDKHTFQSKYCVKTTGYTFRNSFIPIPCSRTNYGEQKLAVQIPNLLHDYALTIDLLKSGISKQAFKNDKRIIILRGLKPNLFCEHYDSASMYSFLCLFFFFFFFFACFS